MREVDVLFSPCASSVLEVFGLNLGLVGVSVEEHRRQYV